MKLSELASRIGGEVVGDGSIEITSGHTLEEAGPGQISFLANPKYARQLEGTRAGAVIVSPRIKAEGLNLVRAKDPYYAFMQAMVILHGHKRHPHPGIHPKAHVESSAVIGEGSVLYPGVYIGANTRVGRDCILYPNVVIYDNCIIGDRVILHANTSIGEDGFGFATHGGVHHKIPPIGNVIIEDDVEIGANCSIDRATLGSTVVGRGTKMSNAVVVGHNSRIGEHGLLVAQVGIAGSVTIGHHVSIGGQTGLAGHLKLGNNVSIAAKSGVMDDAGDNEILLGAPAMPASKARRAYAAFTKLPELVERIKKLESGGMGGMDDEDWDLV